ncbi:MAG: helix-turn-helix domain-containing protein [Candidatus Phocaeicola merdigallinarum]|nr:helix-turn-helix domain-containing protein [Candidatus Phocaeicola merdigallinarum]
MNIIELLNNGANVQLVINALDLKEAFLQWNEETRQPDAERKAESYLSAQETADKLGVDVSTLWRWDKSGYLKKIKVGNKIRYRESDVLKLMEG